jgi:hypothetical protein
MIFIQNFDKIYAKEITGTGKKQKYVADNFFLSIHRVTFLLSPNKQWLNLGQIQRSKKDSLRQG